MPGDRPPSRAFPHGHRSRTHWESLPHGWGHAGPPRTCSSVRSCSVGPVFPPGLRFPDSNGSSRAKSGSTISGAFRLSFEPSG
ncbi:hypothetical protein GFS60_02774 [Rhodococcus sp. WAY2]|nr:hypothetical protein GFS60_02774 [Rhodococcus sp. WAY2]